MLGPGILWVDDFEIFDLAFTREERTELNKIIALADVQLNKRQIGDCLATLERFWPQYLLQHVPEQKSRVARTSPSLTRQKPAAKPTPSTRMIDRVKRMLPRIRR